MDHYKCYSVKRTPGAPRFTPISGVSLEDQFITVQLGGVAKRFALKKPTRLCNPVDKNGEGVKHPAAHLACYQAVPRPGQLRHVSVPTFLSNQFGPERLSTIEEEELCVPSVKIP